MDLRRDIYQLRWSRWCCGVHIDGGNLNDKAGCCCDLATEGKRTENAKQVVIEVLIVSDKSLAIHIHEVAAKHVGGSGRCVVTQTTQRLSWNILNTKINSNCQQSTIKSPIMPVSYLILPNQPFITQQLLLVMPATEAKLERTSGTLPKTHASNHFKSLGVHSRNVTDGLTNLL